MAIPSTTSTPAYQTAFKQFKSHLKAYELESPKMAQAISEKLIEISEKAFSARDGIIELFDNTHLSAQLDKDLKELDQAAQDEIHKSASEIKKITQYVRAKFEKLGRSSLGRIAQHVQTSEDTLKVAEELLAKGDKAQSVHAFYRAMTLALQEGKTELISQCIEKIESIEHHMELLQEHEKAQILSQKQVRQLQNRVTQLETQLGEFLQSEEIVKTKFLSGYIFGKKQWTQYLGDIGEEPPLPTNIYEILNSNCSFWPGKKVHETHVLTLIPQAVNGQPLTLKTLGELVQKPLQGHATKYVDFRLDWQDVVNRSAPYSHWTLLSRDVIPESQNKLDANNRELVQKYAGYEMPNILDATVSIFMEYIRNGIRIYPADVDLETKEVESASITTCQERLVTPKYVKICCVGLFFQEGLLIDEGSDVVHAESPLKAGIGAQRKFLNESVRVNQLEMQLAEIVKTTMLAKYVFGKKRWARYFGDVGAEPPLPANIHEILRAPCPIWPEKKVYETHLLTLIPPTINGQPLTIQKLGELVQKPLQGSATKYERFNLGQYNDQPTPRSHWTLLTRDVIPNSRSKNYAAQQQVASAYGGYEIPNVLDTTVTLFMEHVQSGTRLYEGMLTRCQEKFNANYQLAVGRFAAGGLGVDGSGGGEHDGVGVGVSRKFV